MIQIAVHIPNPHDATNWYRGTGPLSALRKLHKNMHVEIIKEWSYSTVQMKDLAFFQRPSTKQELEAIRICKRLHVPVIVDYDDLLFDLPRDNPAYRMYMNKETQETIITIMREADCIWVSTKELKRCIQVKNGSLNERVYVIPNALDDVHLVKGYRSSPPEIKKRNNAVVWRGSATHDRDVAEYTKEIIECSEKFEKTSFVFIGHNPWFLTEGMRQRQAILSGAMPVGEFMEFMYGTAGKIGIVPLHESRFNKCKSNIAWLEMVWSGGVVLAPDWEEWRMPGCVTYKNQTDFKDGLDHLLSLDVHQLNEMNQMSWKHIQENFMLSVVNKLRHDTIMALLGTYKWDFDIATDGWPDGWQRLPDEDDKVMDLS